MDEDNLLGIRLEPGKEYMMEYDPTSRGIIIRPVSNNRLTGRIILTCCDTEHKNEVQTVYTMGSNIPFYIPSNHPQTIIKLSFEKRRA